MTEAILAFVAAATIGVPLYCWWVTRRLLQRVESEVARLREVAP